MNPDSINLHAWILRQHGREVLKLLRKSEKIETKLGAWLNYRHFNLRCVHSNITPNSIRLHSNVYGESANKLLQKTEKKLLEIRSRQCNYTIDGLKEWKEFFKWELATKIPEVDKPRIEAFIVQTHRKSFEVNKQRQIDKFAKLQEYKLKSELDSTPERSDEIKKRWVINVSSRKLSQPEESLLQ